MLIAQISDFHVTALDALAYGCVDANAMLQSAVRALNALRPLPDLVIGTGDLTQSGADEEYALLAGILEGLYTPFVPVAGNHDRRVAVRRGFARAGATSEQTHFLQYALDLGELRLLVLDTVREGSDEPEYCAERLAWLAANLPSDKPTLLAMHHPPFATGIDWLDAKDPDWSAPIGDLVAQASNVVRIVCGHVHRGIHRTWRGVPVSTAPSVAHQVALDLTPGAPPRFSFEAPGFQLHRWDGRDLTTYAVTIDGFSDRFAPDTLEAAD